VPAVRSTCHDARLQAVRCMLCNVACSARHVLQGSQANLCGMGPRTTAVAAAAHDSAAGTVSRTENLRDEPLVAANNLAMLLAQQGRFAEAGRILRGGPAPQRHSPSSSDSRLLHVAGGTLPLAKPIDSRGRSHLASADCYDASTGLWRAPLSSSEQRWVVSRDGRTRARTSPSTQRELWLPHCQERDTVPRVQLTYTGY
jgi:hypothetical protein